jgi:hypothetical protein
VAKVYVHLIGFVCSEYPAVVAGRQHQKCQPFALRLAWADPPRCDEARPDIARPPISTTGS